MVNPRWRPTIANSRKITKSKQKDDIVDGFDLPPPDKYIGRDIDTESDDDKVSNPSYKKYYKDLV